MPVLGLDISPPRATLTIDDPERRNPLSNRVVADLTDGLVAAAADSSVRVIVLTGAGDQAFSAGGDLSGGFVDDPVATHGERGALAGLLRAMVRCGTPTIARVNGHALGGGFGLVAACDVAIAREGALFGMPEIGVGLWPMMISAVVARAMPRRAALELMLTGRRIDAHEARALGIVSRVVSSGDLDAAVDETVAAISDHSPAVIRMGRDAFYATADLDLDTALDHLHAGLTAVAASDDAAEGIAAFLDKRRPEWGGR